MHARTSLTLLAIAAGLAGCGFFGKRTPAGDDAPTLASLAQRQVDVRPDAGPPRDEARAIAAYQAFLAAAPASSPSAAPQRAEAMRRLGDLEMDLADKRLADGDAPDYRAAIARYQAFLKANPKDPGNDRVVYQLARAQEQGGQLDAALKSLDALVAAHPNTRYRDEVEFRRGELLFAARRYAQAEAAYSTVLAAGAGNPFLDRALFMQGWSRYKQGRLDDALDSFFGVLDIKLGGRVAADDQALADLPGLTRGDQELLDDTLRVVSLSLESLQGAASIAAHVRGERRAAYEYRVYQQLGELYLKQDRSKDAADTFAQYARAHPLAPMAPLAQSRVIAIYEGSGFDSLALAAKRDYVVAYGADSALRQSNPEGWQRAQPRVRAHLAELARHHHALAQKTHAARDIDEAVRWYRAGLDAFPDDASGPAQRFLLGELLFESGRHAEAAIEYERSAYAATPHARSADAGYAALLAYDALIKAADATRRPALQRAQVDSAQRFAATFAADPRRAPVLANAAETLFALHQPEPAAALARQVLALQPGAPPAQRRVAWTV
ncbi:MAG: tetratricopeptide repeat protein, partial [Burkholderiales bacterium]|nr:tetratricopeptide repeat protein [Burkholderiales bacterium]